MGGLNEKNGREPFLSEGVHQEFFEATERDRAVAGLDHPWIAHEGSLDARLESIENGELPQLLPRGLAFDETTTVIWDEDEVQVLRAAPPQDGVLALESPVLVAERFRQMPPGLHRIDYLRDGLLLGSRYVIRGSEEPQQEGVGHHA